MPGKISLCMAFIANLHAIAIIGNLCFHWIDARKDSYIFPNLGISIVIRQNSTVLKIRNND
jgi:hypothetical protein